jgi:hypothetical protein
VPLKIISGLIQKNIDIKITLFLNEKKRIKYVKNSKKIIIILTNILVSKLNIKIFNLLNKKKIYKKPGGYMTGKLYAFQFKILSIPG